ncbi:unnamed protein product [Lampetra fluviatilis]
MGVRRVTTPQGRHVVNQLNELHDGSAYLCSDHHRRHRQPHAPPPHPPNRRPAAGVGNVNEDDDDDRHHHHDRHDYHQQHHDHNQHDHHQQQQHQRHRHGRDDLQETQRGGGGGGGGGWRPVVQPPREPRRSGGHIKRLTLFRNGAVGPQRALLLSRQSAPNLEAVLAYFSEILQCPVRQLYTRNGSRVESLEGLFNGPSSLVAAGSEPFRAVAYDGVTSRHKLPGLAKVARGPEPSATPANFGLEASKKVIHPRLPSSRHSRYSFSIASDRVYGNGDSSTASLVSSVSRLAAKDHHQEDHHHHLPHGHTAAKVRRTDKPSDVRKQIRVNTDGSMTVEMNVRLNLEEEETVRWVTNISREKSGAERRVGQTVTNEGYGTDDSIGPMGDDGSVTIACCDDDDEVDDDDEMQRRRRCFEGKCPPMENLFGVNAKRQVVDELQRAALQQGGDAYEGWHNDRADDAEFDNDGRSSSFTSKNERFSFFTVAEGEVKERRFDSSPMMSMAPAATNVSAMAMCNDVLEYCTTSRCSTHSSFWSSVSSRRQPRKEGADRGSGVGGEEEEEREAMELRGEVVGSDGIACVDDDGGGGGGGACGGNGGDGDSCDGGESSDVGRGNEGGAGSFQGSERLPSGGSDATTLASAGVTGEMDPASVMSAEPELDSASVAADGERDLGGHVSIDGELTLVHDPRDIPSSLISSQSRDSHLGDKAACGLLSRSERPTVMSPALSATSKSKTRSRGGGGGGGGENMMPRPSPSPSLNSSHRSHRSRRSAASTDQKGRGELLANNCHPSHRTSSIRGVSDDGACSTVQCEDGEVGKENDDDDGECSHTSPCKLSDAGITTPATRSDRGQAQMATPRIECHSGSTGGSKASSLLSESISARHSQTNQEDDGEKSCDGRRKAPSSHSSAWSKSYEEGSPGPASLKVVSRHSKSGVSGTISRAASSVSSADGPSLVPVPPHGRGSRSSHAQTTGSSRRDRLRVTSRNGSSMATAPARSLKVSGREDRSRASSDGSKSRPASLGSNSRSELDGNAGTAGTRRSRDSGSVNEIERTDSQLSEALVSQLTDLPEESPEDVVRKWLTRIPSRASTIQDDFFTDLDLIPEEEHGGGAAVADADAGAEHEGDLGHNATPFESNGETGMLLQPPSDDQDERSASETQAEENRDWSVLHDSGNCRHSSEKENGIRHVSEQQLRLNKKLFRLLKQLFRNQLSHPELKKSNSMPELTDESWALRNQSIAINIAVSLLSSLETTSNEDEASTPFVPLTDVAQRLRKLGPGSSDRHRSLTSEQLLHLRKLLTSQTHGRRKQMEYSSVAEGQVEPEEKKGSTLVEESGDCGRPAVCNDNGYGSNNGNKNGDGESKKALDDDGDGHQEDVVDEEEEANEDEGSHVFNGEANADMNGYGSNGEVDDAEGVVYEEQSEGDEGKHEDDEESDVAEDKRRLENGGDDVAMEINEDVSQGGDEKAREMCEADEDIIADEAPKEEAGIEEIEEGGDDVEATGEREVEAVEVVSAAAEEKEEMAVADCNSAVASEGTAVDEGTEDGSDCEDDAAENGDEGEDVSIKDPHSEHTVGEVAEGEADETGAENDVQNEAEVEMNDNTSQANGKTEDGESEACDFEQNAKDDEATEKEMSPDEMGEDVDDVEANSGKDGGEEECTAEDELAPVNGGEDKHEEVDEEGYAGTGGEDDIADEVDENVEDEVGGEHDDLEQDADPNNTSCVDEEQDEQVYREDELEEEEETKEQPEAQEHQEEVEQEDGQQVQEHEEDIQQVEIQEESQPEDQEEEKHQQQIEEERQQEEHGEEAEQEEHQEESKEVELEDLEEAEEEDQQENIHEGAEQELQEEQELEKAKQEWDDQGEEHEVQEEEKQQQEEIHEEADGEENQEEEDTEIPDAEDTGECGEMRSKSESCPVDNEDGANEDSGGDASKSSCSEDAFNNDNAEDAVEEKAAPETSLDNDEQMATENEEQVEMNDESSIHDELSESDAENASRPESAGPGTPTLQEEDGNQEDGKEEVDNIVQETSTSASDSEKAHSDHGEESADGDSSTEAEGDLEDACTSVTAVEELQCESSTLQPRDAGRCRDVGTQVSLDEDEASGRWRRLASSRALGGGRGGSTVLTPPTPDIASRVCWSRNESTDMPHEHEVVENPERTLKNQQPTDVLSAAEDSDPQWIVSENYLRRRALPQQCVAELDTTSGETSDEAKYLRLNRPLQMDDISSSELEDTLSPEPCCNFYREPHGTDSDPFPSDACSFDSLKAAKLPAGEKTASASTEHLGSVRSETAAAEKFVEATDRRASLMSETAEAGSDEGRSLAACGNYCTILTALQTDEGRLFSPYRKVFDPSDPWVVHLVCSLERQCMAQWLNVLEDAKTRWGMEGEEINEIILEVKRDAQRRIRRGILAELEKIKISIVGKVPQKVGGSMVESVASRMLRKSSPGILEAQSRNLAHVIAELNQKQGHNNNDNNNGNGKSVSIEGAPSTLRVTEENVYATFQIPQIIKEFDLKLILNADAAAPGGDGDLDDNNGNPGNADQEDEGHELLSQGNVSTALNGESLVGTDAEFADNEATEGQSESACQDYADGSIETEEAENCVNEVAGDEEVEAAAHINGEEVLEAGECEGSLPESATENDNDRDNDGDDSDGAREETAIKEAEAGGENAEADLTLEDELPEDSEQDPQMEACEDCEEEVQPESSEVNDGDEKEEGGSGESDEEYAGEVAVLNRDELDMANGGVEDGEDGNSDAGSGVGQENADDDVKEGDEVEPQSEHGAASDQADGSEDADMSQGDHVKESEAGEDDVSQEMVREKDATDDDDNEVENGSGEQVEEGEEEDVDGSGGDSGEGGASNQDVLDSQSGAEEEGGGGDDEVGENVSGDEGDAEHAQKEADNGIAEAQGEEEHIDTDDALEQEDANEGGDDCEVTGDEGGEEEVGTNAKEEGDEEAAMSDEVSQNGSAPEEEDLQNCDQDDDMSGSCEAPKENGVDEQEGGEDEGEAAIGDEEEPVAEDCDGSIGNDGDHDVAENKGVGDDDGHDEGDDVEPEGVEGDNVEDNEDVGENVEESDAGANQAGNEEDAEKEDDLQQDEENAESMEDVEAGMSNEEPREEDGEAGVSVTSDEACEQSEEVPEENEVVEHNGVSESNGESSPVAEDENALRNTTDNDGKEDSSRNGEQETSLEGESKEGEDQKVEAEEEEANEEDTDIGSCDSSTAVKGSSSSSQGAEEAGAVHADESEGTVAACGGAACVSGRARRSRFSTKSIAGEEQCADDIDGDDLDF